MIKTLLVAIAFMATGVSYAQTDTTKVDSAAYWKQFDLKEVNVTAARKLIKQDIDRVTYDVSRDEEAKTNNTLDMLRKVPMVSVDGQDNIRVQGSSNFKIYKNGHPDPSFEGSTVSQVLKAMPANTIKKIEVITEPGAKYDAEGTSMILNIVMKDNAGMSGVSGTVNFASTNRGDIQPGINLTTQTGKLTLSANYNFINIRTKAMENKQTTDFYYKDSGERLLSRQNFKGPVKGHFGNISASYEIDSLNLVSLSGSAFYILPDLLGNVSTTRYDKAGNNIYSFDQVFTTPDYNQYNINGRVDYQHKTHLDGEVLTLSYMGVTTQSDQNTDNTFSNLTNVPFSYTGYSQRQHERFFEHTAQIDYVRPLGKTQKAGIGAKYINRSNKSHTVMDYTNFDSGDMDNRFNHNTQVAAAYAEWMGTFGKLNIRAGLRYEYSHMKATYPNGSGAGADLVSVRQQGFSKNLNDWCPSLNVQYKLDDFNTLTANFSTTINRPGIEYLNPARVETPTTISEGAPGLSSETNRRVSLTFMHVGSKFTYSISPTFTFTNNQIADLQGVQDGKTWTSYGNVNHTRNAYVSAFAQINPWTTGNISVNFDGGYQRYKNHSINLDLGGWYGDYNINFQQCLPWQLVFNAGAGGNFGRQPESVYGLSSTWSYHQFTIMRSFLKDNRLTVMLAAVNPFQSHSAYKNRVVQGDYTGIHRQIESQSHQFLIRVSYRFGSLKARVKTVDRSIENNDVIGGIKQQGGNDGKK